MEVELHVLRVVWKVVFLSFDFDLILILQDPQLPSLLARSQLPPFTITPPPPYHHVTKTTTTHRTHSTPKTSKKQNFKVRVFANAIEFNFGNRHSDGNHVPFELCQAANHLGLELELELEVQRQTCNTTQKRHLFAIRMPTPP